MKIQECVFDKIEDAYNEFKEKMLKKDPEEIFEKAYKISIIAEIFDVLFDAYEFSPHETEIVLEFKGNILEQFYDEWLKHEDGFRSEIAECIDKNFASLRQAAHFNGNT